jgi:hypothetical protein
MEVEIKKLCIIHWNQLYLPVDLEFPKFRERLNRFFSVTVELVSFHAFFLPKKGFVEETSITEGVRCFINNQSLVDTKQLIFIMKHVKANNHLQSPPKKRLVVDSSFLFLCRCYSTFNGRGDGKEQFRVRFVTVSVG